MQFFVKPAGDPPSGSTATSVYRSLGSSVASGLVNAKNAAGWRGLRSQTWAGVFRITVSWVNTTATSQNGQIRLTNGTTDSYTETTPPVPSGVSNSPMPPVTAINPIEAEGDSITQGYSPTRGLK